MTTMLEKMARAIGRAEGWGSQEIDDYLPEFSAMAREALMAIREPSNHTGGMVDVGYETMRHREVTTHKDAERCFTAMIDAILNEEQPHG